MAIHNASTEADEGVVTKHFTRLRYLPPVEAVYSDIPGVIGDVINHITDSLVEFEQYGLAILNDTLKADILDGRGDPTKLFQVETSRNGTINNCRKMLVEFDSVQTGDGSKAVSYRILWRQIAP